MIDYTYIPNSAMEYGIRSYVEKRIRPGSFLSAILSNNLIESFRCADQNNAKVMHKWAAWIYNEMPLSMVGSQEKFNKHLNGEEDKDGR